MKYINRPKRLCRRRNYYHRYNRRNHLVGELKFDSNVFIKRLGDNERGYRSIISFSRNYHRFDCFNDGDCHKHCRSTKLYA